MGLGTTCTGCRAGQVSSYPHQRVDGERLGSRATVEDKSIQGVHNGCEKATRSISRLRQLYDDRCHGIHGRHRKHGVNREHGVNRKHGIYRCKW